MLLKLLIIAFGISAVMCRRHVQFYRRDYTYLKQFDAFYKLHLFYTDHSDWFTAFFKCKAEGSQLFYPGTSEEWNIVKDLMQAKNLSETEVPFIYVGIQNEGVEEFITVDGRTTPYPLSNNKQHQSGHLCTVLDTQTGFLYAEKCKNDHHSKDKDITAFVCKKVEDIIISCPTIDHEYSYVKESKKCYKINKNRETWHGALHTCEMEGGLLVNIENRMEVNILHNMMDGDSTYHAGFRMIPPYGTDYYNLKGTNVKDTHWEEHTSWEDHEDRECGAIKSRNNNLYFTSLDCDQKQPFVCEIEVKI